VFAGGAVWFGRANAIPTANQRAATIEAITDSEANASRSVAVPPAVSPMTKSAPAAKGNPPQSASGNSLARAPGYASAPSARRVHCNE
jgi:hypothetical protein